MYSIGLLILFPLPAGIPIARTLDSTIRARRIRWSAGAIAVATLLLTLLHLALWPEFYSIPDQMLWTLDRFFMLGVLFVLPLLFWWRPPRFSEVSGYLSGANVDGSASYRGAMGAERMVESRGYYLTGFFQETTLIRYGGLGTTGLIALMIGGAAL